jgi:hypothetical protein
MNREELLRRYRHLRAINKRQQTDALDCVSQATLLDCARRLDLARGRTLVLEDFDEMTLVFDLVVHAGIGGRARAIDRYAAKARPTAGSDDELMLAAARKAEFAVWKVERRHEVVGLHIVDVVTGQTLWLIDEALETTSRDGQMCASRLMEAHRSMPRWSPASRTDMVQDPRFALGIYRAAVRTGTTERMRYLDPGEPDLLEYVHT